MFGPLADRKAVNQRKKAVARLDELTKPAGGLAHHGQASLALAGLI